jgi:hypothetical protein
LAHPPSLILNLSFNTRLLSLVGKNPALGERADQLSSLAAEHGFPYWSAEAKIYRGWVKIKNGDLSEGISYLRSGSTAFRATGAELWMPYHTALLAGACEIAGQMEEALTLLDDALRIVERTGERWFAAELNRHKGELLLQQGQTGAAERCIAKPWASTASRRPSSGNCAPPSASLGFAATRIGAPKPAISSPRSTAGSPRVSTPPTSKKRRRCSTSWRELVETRSEWLLPG